MVCYKCYNTYIVDYLRVTMKTIALTPEQYEKVRQKKLALQSKLKRELSYGEFIEISIK